MSTTRRRVFGALVAGVLAAGAVVGLGAVRSDIADTATSIRQGAFTADVAVSAEIVRGDKHETRRLLTELVALAAVLTALGLAATPRRAPAAHLPVATAASRHGPELGRAPPLFL